MMNRIDKLYREAKKLFRGRVFVGIIWPEENGACLEMELPDTGINCVYSSVEEAQSEANNLAASYGITDDELLLITVDYGERWVSYG